MVAAAASLSAAAVWSYFPWMTLWSMIVDILGIRYRRRCRPPIRWHRHRNDSPRRHRTRLRAVRRLHWLR